MTVKLDLEMLNAEDFMSIAGCARRESWEGLRNWLFQVAYHQNPEQAPRA